MKKPFLLLTFVLLPFFAIGQTQTANEMKEKITVQAACGQCQFNMPGFGCDLAVRMEDKVYFVKDGNIDAHGDAHAKEGLCNAIRMAEVSGKVVDDKFEVTYFKLRPYKKENKN